MAENPPGGAVIDYFLARPAAGPVRLEVLDARGQTVRAFASDDPPEKLEARPYFTDRYIHPPPPPPASAGHHRFVWDLRYPRPKSNRHEYLISAIAGEDTPVEPRGPLALPGRYTVRLTVDGKRQDQPLELMMDPRVSAAPAALAERADFERRLVAAMGESLDAVPLARSAKDEARAKQLESINGLLGNLLTAVDGADAPPTSVQKDAYARARSELDTLLAKGKGAR